MITNIRARREKREDKGSKFQTKQMFRTAEKKMLRNITENSLMDTMRNEEIREICGIQDVVR